MPHASWWPEAAFMVAITAAIGAAVAAELPTTQRQTELRHLLEHDCGSCHGLTRRGGLGPALLPDALNDRDDDFLVDTIMFGRRGTPMGPWGTELTRGEARWLVDRMRGR